MQDLKRQGVNLLIVDAPIRPDVYSAWEDGYYQPYIEYMQETLSPLGIPFWLTRDISESIPARGWYDLQHVNEFGVPLFSAWLGERLAEEYPPEFFQ